MHNELHGSPSPRVIKLKVGDILGEPHDLTSTKLRVGVMWMELGDGAW